MIGFKLKLKYTKSYDSSRKEIKMEKEKLKETYQNADVKIILLEFSDIVTSSDSNKNGEGPDIGDVGGDDWS